MAFTRDMHTWSVYMACTCVGYTWRIPRVDNPPRGQIRQWAWKTKSRFEKGGKSKTLRIKPSLRATRPQRREARDRPVHSRTRLAFLCKIMAATSIFVNAAFFGFCLFTIILRSPRRPLIFVWG